MRQTITVGTKVFKTQKECKDYTRTILTELGINPSVKCKNNEHFNFLLSLCERHPRYEEKFQDFCDFRICHSALNARGLELQIINNDGTCTEISWNICVSGKSSTKESSFNSALRQHISPQIMNFKETNDLSYCRECEHRFVEDSPPIHIDHVIQFKQLVETFLKINTHIIIPTKYEKKERTYETLFTDSDLWIGKLFEKYHYENAVLRVLCEPCNLKRPKYKSD